MFPIEMTERLKALPPYLFKELDRRRQEVRDRGVDIIDLGVGDPDRPTPTHIIDKLKQAADDPVHHQYPSYVGMPAFRRSVAGWYDRRFGLKLDPDREVITLIGSKEGIAHIHLALINPGDVALIPEPAYPVYHTGTVFAGGVSLFMPLTAENGFLPDLNAIPVDVAEKAKVLFINYPNNPTGAVADPAFYDRVVTFAAKHQIIVVSDAAYSEVTMDGYRAPSFLQAEGAMDIGVEFHSLSKTYNMTGWRIGWAAGRADVIELLGRVKSNIDSGAFQAVQVAGIEALEGDQSIVEEMRRVYTRRRDVLVPALRELGMTADLPKATFYLWVSVPRGYDSAGFAAKLLDEAGIVSTPGSGFGPSGEGYIRFALTKEEDRLREAATRIKNLKL
jgi:LL-diaminopimelate aminotransferase